MPRCRALLRQRFQCSVTFTSCEECDVRARPVACVALLHPMDELVEHVVALPEREVALLAPRDGEALLTEEAFAQEEFLPYWAELWPSALALARAVARRPLTGRRTIELGCGLGLAAIAAAVAGARVLATDWSPDAVAITARNAERNGAELATALFRWDADPRALGPPWP